MYVSMYACMYYVCMHVRYELCMYEGRLQSSWTHLTIPSRNFMEERWWSLFRSTSLCKRCTSTTFHPLLEID